jgi:NAD(P)-dependent dehydrogenase (short-subunit alcohol dehydrogenase family)
VKELAGRIDVLFVNAGFYEFGTFGEITEEHFDKTFNTNVRGLLFAVQKALPLLSKGASVILTGSIASSIGIPSFSVYNATKAAVRSFARSWILDLRGRGIRVNVLSPVIFQRPASTSCWTRRSRPALSRRFRWTASARPTISPGQRYSSPPTTARTSPASS